MKKFIHSLGCKTALLYFVFSLLSLHAQNITSVTQASTVSSSLTTKITDPSIPRLLKDKKRSASKTSGEKSAGKSVKDNSALNANSSAFQRINNSNLKLNTAANSNNAAILLRPDNVKNSRTSEGPEKSNTQENFTSPLDAMKGKQEDVTKRDAYSKHFKNSDGSFTAIIGAGQIHYEKNGKWADIDTKVEKSSYKNYTLSNTANVMESYFGKSTEGILSKTAEGEVKEFLNAEMFWEVKGQKINVLKGRDVLPKVDDDRVSYNNLFGRISAEYTVQTGKRKLNYIIPDRDALGKIPEKADYLVFSEEIQLPAGFSISKELKLETPKINSQTSMQPKIIKGIFILDSKGKAVYSFEAPFLVEKFKSGDFPIPTGEKPTLEYKIIAGKIILFTKVQTKWLLSANRIFPIAIDPTAVLYPYNVADASGYSTPTVGASGNIYAGYDNGWNRGWVTFNTSSLPSVLTVNSASLSVVIGAKVGTFNATTNTIRLGHSEYDLSSAYYFPAYADVYNAITNPANAFGAYNQIGNYAAGATVRTFDLAPTSTLALTEIAEKTGNGIAFFPVSFSPSWGTGTVQRYYGIFGYNDATRKPYLTVTYSTTDKYCHSAHLYANAASFLDAQYIGISNVKIGTINNATTFDNVPIGYHKYNLSTDLSIGNTYPLQVTYRDNGSPYNRGKIAAWVDWNDDGDFADADEYIGTSPNTTSGNQVVPFNVTVPTGTSVGIKRMRIRSAFGSDPGQSMAAGDFCKILSYGETEDYDVNVIASVSCDPVTASASEYVVCANKPTTLTASSTTTGYTYTWYTGWDNETHTGTVIEGTGNSIVVKPNVSTLYGVVATKTGCPTGVNAAYDLITIAVTPAPTLVVLDPVSAITCSNELSEINVVGGGIIPNDALDENFDGDDIPWIVRSNIGDDGLWGLYDSGGTFSSTDNSTFAIVGSIFAGNFSGVMESSLISEPISLKDYDTPINLTFNHTFWADYAIADVDISTDRGQTWTTLKSYSSDVGGPTSFQPESIGLNAYAGNDFILLRFNYFALEDDWFWAVDDIKITGSPKPTTIIWSPTAGLYTDMSRTPYLGGSATTLYASPLNTTTYTITAQTLVGCPAETTVIVERGDKDWGGISTNWNTPANWSEGTIPTANHCVIIPSTAQKPIITVGTDAFAKNLTVKAGAGLRIDGNLTVTAFVKNEATQNDVVVSSEGNLNQVNDNPLPANSGAITAKRDVKLSAGRQQYNYLISPLENQSLATVYKDAAGNPVPVPFVLYHSEATNKFYNSTGAYIKGRGLALKEPAVAFAPTVMTTSFSGNPTNGAFTFGLVNSNLSDTTKGYNLTGNPYPSNIDLRKLYDINGGKTDPTQVTSPNISATFYLWDNNGNTIYEQQGSSYLGQSYALFNVLSGSNGTGTAANSGTKIPTKIVKVGQGFMTKSLKSTYNLNFNNSIRTTQSTAIDYLGKENSAIPDDRYWLKMTAPSGIVSTIAVVYYAGGSNLFGAEDSRTLEGSDAVYSIVENENVGINGRSSFTDTDKIPLGTKHFSTGSYTFELAGKEGLFESAQNIYLKDKQNGVITNLTQGNYIFTANEGASAGRFEIIYKPESVLVTDSVIKEDLVIYREGQDFIIRSTSKKIDEVEVYDPSGRLMYTLKPHDTKALLHSEYLTRGIYLLKIKQGDLLTTKKIIK